MFNRIVGHAMGKDFDSKMNGRFSMQNFVKNNIVFQLGRRLENRKLGELIGSEKIRNWVKDRISINSHLNVNLREKLANSSFCISPSCIPIKTREECVANRNKWTETRNKTGNTLSLVGGFVWYAGLESQANTAIAAYGNPYLGGALVFYDLITLAGATSRCKGDYNGL